MKDRSLDPRTSERADIAQHCGGPHKLARKREGLQPDHQEFAYLSELFARSLPRKSHSDGR